MGKDIIPKSISELSSYRFKVPYQQRGYKWTPDNISILIKDLHEFIHSEKIMYCLQPVTVYFDAGEYVVIDGQQRLTTLYLLQKYFIEEHNASLNTYSISYDRDKNNERSNLLSGKISNLDETDSDSFF